MDVIARLRLTAANMQEVKEKAGNAQVILSPGDKPKQLGVSVSFLLLPGDTLDISETDDGVRTIIIAQAKR